MTVRLAWAPVPEGAVRREVAWSLLRDLVPGARVSHLCSHCGGPHGRVRLSGSSMVGSVSYAGSMAFVAVADAAQAASVGVDAERADGGRAELRGVLHPDLPADLRTWTRVEAALKADGRGLRVDPASVTVAPRAGGWRAVVPGRAAPIEGTDADGPPGFVVATAIVPPVRAAAAVRAGRSTH